MRAFNDDELKRIADALMPLAKVGNAYYKSGLDEHRPEWDRENPKDFRTIHLIDGRGGNRLVTLDDALRARGVVHDFGLDML